MLLWPFDGRSPQLIESHTIFPFPWFTFSSLPNIGECIVVVIALLSSSCHSFMSVTNISGLFRQCPGFYSRFGKLAISFITQCFSISVNSVTSAIGMAVSMYFSDIILLVLSSWIQRSVSSKQGLNVISLVFFPTTMQNVVFCMRIVWSTGYSIAVFLSFLSFGKCYSLRNGYHYVWFVNIENTSNIFFVAVANRNV